MKKINLLLLAGAFLGLVSCGQKKTQSVSVAVFIPGTVANSPVYAMLQEGVEAAVEEYNKDKVDDAKVSLKIMEAGTNQAEWGNQLTALTAEQKYDVIISSNSSLPDLALPILEQFPDQKYIFLDASLEGNSNMYTACYNQYEQAFLSGYSSGLMSKSHKVALIAAQEYPVMNNIILPYYEKGAKAANPETTVDFRIVGNWYDANQGALLAEAAIKNGVDVILPICGGAAQGVINTAVNKGAYVAWFDDDGFSKAPGTVISSSVMKQKEMAMIATTDYLNGKTKWGKAEMFGLKEGFIDFVQDHPSYIETVPADIRKKIADKIEEIRENGF